MRWAGVFVAFGMLAGCDGGGVEGPFEGLPLDGDFQVGLGAPVQVARDRYGIAHISARTLPDAAFVQGYVMAHDRLPQMEILRRFGSGTLAELFGGLDPAVIDRDLEMRVHRMRPLAEQSWAMLEASSDPLDAEVVQLLARFADGVNAYVRDLGDGRWTIDPAIAPGFDPAQAAPWASAPWSPIDSLVIARFEAFARSYSAPFELDATELYEKLRTFFDGATSANPAGVARHGISRDLLRLAPIGTEPTIPGFPNVLVDTGSRSDGSDPGASAAIIAPPAGAALDRPPVPQPLLDAARTFFARDPHDGPLGALGPQAFLHPLASEATWAVGPGLAGGRALLAAEQHLLLTNPSLFYPTHLIATDDDLDVMGVTLPGIPGVLSGTNGSVAWSAAASEHDVTDVYVEQIAPCPGGEGDCVAWTDPSGEARAVPIETFREDIRIGVGGAITAQETAIYERVPHHGPIIPAIDHASHELVPRTGASALSVRGTGDRPSFELRALHRLARARSVEDGFRALEDITYGGQSWALIDNQGHIGFTSQAVIPLRKPAAYAWDPLVRQDGLAPFFVLPGTGEADWIEGQALSPRFIPHAIDPAQGYLVATNADPVGATFDGKPLDQGVVDGEPLYAGIRYTPGLRQARITALIRALERAGRPVTLDDMAAIQRDTHSSVGQALAPAILAALGRLDRQDFGPPDVNPYLDALSPADAARLATARALLTRWTFATPAAGDDSAGDSAATALLATWMHFFVERTLKDELDAVGFDVWRLDDNLLVRVIYALLHDPGSFVTSPATQQPIVCDNYDTAGPDDSCTKAILQAMVDAMIHLESPDAFGTADVSAWRWGRLHRLAVTPLFPDPALALPGSGDPDPGGFSRAGDSFAVDGGDPGWSDLDFSRRAGGAAQRFLAEATPGQPITVRWAIPGGVIFDTRSRHYRDLLDRYYLTDQLFDAPYSLEQIVAAGESRWVFH
ncbi:MAG TPA: penicillin acylase family protein [Kofleriaceae bacterium]|nr:penicillin acylase family protein [Kofleriaceae bacterium]